VNTDIGAAIDSNHAVAMDAFACLDQLQRELDFHRIECSGFQQLVANTDAHIGTAHAIVQTIDNHRAVIGRGKHEGQLASDIAHEFLLGGGRNTSAG
jgi:hypothetical protein